MIDRIRTIMEYAKMSQQDFAARLGISPASLSSILTGRTHHQRGIPSVSEAIPFSSVYFSITFNKRGTIGG